MPLPTACYDLRVMSREYRCPACSSVVDQSATVCSNSVCRQRLGVKCVTWLTGGYCNGFARAEPGKRDKSLCAHCTGRAGEVGRSVLSYSLIGALGGLLKRK